MTQRQLNLQKQLAKVFAVKQAVITEIERLVNEKAHLLPDGGKLIVLHGNLVMIESGTLQLFSLRLAPKTDINLLKLEGTISINLPNRIRHEKQYSTFLMTLNTESLCDLAHTLQKLA